MRKKVKSAVILALFILLNQYWSGIRAQAIDSSKCVEFKNNLSSIKLENVSITAVEYIGTGNFISAGGTVTYNSLPAFCRVAAILKPTHSSNIRIEVWLPCTNWNGRFLGTGTGGGAGSISYNPLAGGIRRGYATANTDMGTSPGAGTLIDQPEKWADFGYRSTHEMTVVAKKIVQVFYEQAPHHTYFAGCSTGGQQALMEAQRFPEDYNGILAGAPANNRTHLHIDFLLNYKSTNEKPGTAFLPVAKLKFITDLVLKHCAGKDGGAPGDNFLTDPRACHFDPATIPICAEGKDADSCLTPAQLAALKKIYDGPVNPRTGDRIYTSIPFGSENTAGGIILQQNPQAVLGLLYPFIWTFGPAVDYMKFDFDKDIEKLDSVLAPILNANNPDLNPLKKLKGKILMYTGTADPLVPYQDALNYYERVVKQQKSLRKTQDFFRFFLVPGMAHCGGGNGPNDCGQSLSLNVPQDSDHDMLTALVKWVEQGYAPEKLIATSFKYDSVKNEIMFQRPIFPYPKFPEYVKGDVKYPSSYKAVEHPRNGVLVPADKYLR